MAHSYSLVEGRAQNTFGPVCSWESLCKAHRFESENIISHIVFLQRDFSQGPQTKRTCTHTHTHKIPTFQRKRLFQTIFGKDSCETSRMCLYWKKPNTHSPQHHMFYFLVMWGHNSRRMKLWSQEERIHRLTIIIYSWWLNQPISHILVKLDHFPKDRGEI